MAHPFISPELRVDSETLPRPFPDEVEPRALPVCGDVARNLLRSVYLFRASLTARARRGEHN